MKTGTVPPITAVSASPQPLYGTWIHWNPASAASISPARCCGDAGPQVVKFTLPLFARAKAISSGNDFAGNEGCAPTMIGVLATSATGARSLSVSYGTFGYSAGSTGMIARLFGAITSVWPSGSDFATKSNPMMPPAPGLFSTTHGWPIAAGSFSQRRRESRSAAPPAV